MAVKMNKGHIVAIALIGSLIGNIFLAGWFIGFHWQDVPQAPLFCKGDRIGADLFAALRAMPELDSRTHPILRQHLKEIRPNMHAVFDANQRVNQTLLAEPFDPVAVERALNQVADAEYRLRQGTQKVFLEVLDTLTPEERKKLAQHRDEHHPPRGENIRAGNRCRSLTKIMMVR